MLVRNVNGVLRVDARAGISSLGFEYDVPSAISGSCHGRRLTMLGNQAVAQYCRGHSVVASLLLRVTDVNVNRETSMANR